MILIGQYDSPFVRRVAVALRLYEMAYEHRPWSVFADADKIRAYSPLMRVPVLVTDSGMALLDSGSIVDFLDGLAGERALIPASGVPRAKVLRVCALAMGLAEKGVSLVYEGVFHQHISAAWQERCTAQLLAALNALERKRSETTTPFWFGEDLTHADIAVACAVRFLSEAHPAFVRSHLGPAVRAHFERCEGLDAFKSAYQPFYCSAA